MARLIYPVLQQPVLTDAQQPEEVTESRWHQPWSEPKRFKIAPALAVALIASSGNYFNPLPIANDDVPTLQFRSAFSEPVRKPKRLITGAQQDEWLVKAAPFPETVSYDRFGYPWSEPVRHKPRLETALHQFQPLNPFGMTQPENVSYDKFGYAWSEPVRVKPRLRAGANQFLAFQLPGGLPENINYDKWAFQWSEPVRQKPRLSTGLQRADWLVQAAPFEERISYDKWGYAWSEPKRFKRALPTALNPSAVLGAPPSFERVSEDKWHFPWSEPKRFKRGLGASMQAFVPAQVIVPEFGSPRLTLKNSIVRVRILKRRGAVYVGRDFDITEQVETQVFGFDFVNDLAPDDSIVSAEWFCTVAEDSPDTDATPNARLVNTAWLVDSTTTVQRVANMQPNVKYTLRAVCNTSQGDTLSCFSHVLSGVVF